jgi:uncharacterized protein (DUF2267 family)
MSSTGISSLDQSIEKANAWLARIADEFATDDRRLAYRILCAWLHALRDRLTVTIGAHFAAQLKWSAARFGGNQHPAAPRFM